jgi:hypothetical protein
MDFAEIRSSVLGELKKAFRPEFLKPHRRRDRIPPAVREDIRLVAAKMLARSPGGLARWAWS